MSFKKPTEVVVGEYTFYIQPIDAFAKLAIFGDLQRDLLPALGDVLTVVTAPGEGDFTEKAMSQAIEKLSSKLDGKQLLAWAERLLTRDRIAVDVDGDTKPLTNNVRGIVLPEFTDILELMFHVLKTDYAAPLASWLSRSGLGQKLTKVAG